MPQIHIRPAIAEDIPVLMQIPHHSQAPIVWQMEKFEEEAKKQSSFGRCVSPVQAGRIIPALPHILKRDGQSSPLWRWRS